MHAKSLSYSDYPTNIFMHLERIRHVLNVWYQLTLLDLIAILMTYGQQLTSTTKWQAVKRDKAVCNRSNQLCYI
jgi:hypothetical protein